MPIGLCGNEYQTTPIPRCFPLHSDSRVRFRAGPSEIWLIETILSISLELVNSAVSLGFACFPAWFVRIQIKK